MIMGMLLRQFKIFLTFKQSLIQNCIDQQTLNMSSRVPVLIIAQLDWPPPVFFDREAECEIPNWYLVEMDFKLAHFGIFFQRVFILSAARCQSALTECTCMPNLLASEVYSAKMTSLFDWSWHKLITPNE